MSPTNKDCDVLICGGGVPGLSLALLLSQLGLDVIVADPAPPLPAADIKPDGRTVALMSGSVNILKTADVWDRCHEYGAALETLRIVEGKTRAEFSAADIGLPYFGVNIPNTRLRAILGEKVSASGRITLIAATIDHFESDDFGISATLGTGVSVRCRLLVGSDGRNSDVRRMCGIDVWSRDYGQSAITCLIEHTRPHDHVSTEFHRPGGPFTMVPMPGLVSSIVWVENTDDAVAMTALRRQDFIQVLQDRTDGLLGAITLLTNPESAGLMALRAERLVAPRVALMAESAHVLHPLGAQGLNLSLRDSAVLAEEIADALRRGQDIGSKAVLDRYQFRRRADILSRSIGTDSMTRLTSNDISLLRDLRGAALKTIQTLSPLRHFAMKEGITPGYDDSRLTRGESL